MGSLLNFSDVSSSSFCERCQGLSFEKLIAGHVLHRSWKELEDAAGHDCSLCVVLWHGILAEASEEWPDEVSPLKTGQECNIMVLYEEGEEPALRVAVFRDGICITMLNFGIYLPNDDFPIHRFRSPEMDPVSEKAIAVVKDWLRGCQTSHQSCPSNLEQKLPTRVIDTEPEQPRLHTTNDEHGAYITLSHCWGKYKGMTTTTHTYKERCKGMAMEDLPKNFRDAIVMTRKLGFRYLWIDALCIIQDSKSDWETEAEKMHTVYRESALTLVAATAPHSQAGFLTQTPIAFKHCALSVPSEENRQQIDLVIYWPRQEKRAGIVETRAWIMQELVLSPRVVHFMSTHPTRRCHLPKLWECRTLVEWEDGDRKFAYPPTRFEFQARSEKMNPLSPTAAIHSDDIYQQWYKFVKSYMNRLLTCPNDKLPALSGMAAIIQDRLNGDLYVAGLWKGDLAIGLLWGALSTVFVPTDYRAPSWSWAGIDASLVYWPRYTLKTYEIEITEVDVVPEGLNRFGRIKSGHLIVRGYVKELTIEPAQFYEHSVRATVFLQGDGRSDEEKVQDQAGPSFVELDLFPRKRMEVLLLKIVEGFQRNERAPGVGGIVLSSTDDTNTFKRIGLFGVHGALTMWFSESEAQTLTLV